MQCPFTISPANGEGNYYTSENVVMYRPSRFIRAEPRFKIRKGFLYSRFCCEPWVVITKDPLPLLEIQDDNA